MLYFEHAPGLAVFLVTLPGTYARLLAVTWGKPVFGCFPVLGWIGFSSWLFGLLSLAFCQLTGFASFLVTHPLVGCLLFFCHGFGVR